MASITASSSESEGIIEHQMADFYIGIGKLHANTELLETIKDALFYYAERIADIQKEVRELDELINNSISAKSYLRIRVSWS